MEIDEEIKDIVEFLNSLKGVRTIGSCAGHNNDETFDSPYITFRCSDERILGMLASVFDMAYSPEEEVEEWVEEYKQYKPELIGDWHIAVIVANDSECKPTEIDANDGYFSYCLSCHPLSYDNPSDISPDYEEMLNYWKWKYKKVMECL